MSLAQSVEGSAFFIPWLAATLLTGWLVVRRRLNHLDGLLRILAVSVLATSAMITAGVLPALLGILSRPTELIAALLLLALAYVLPRAAPRERSALPTPPPSGAPSVAVSLVVVAAATVYEVARLRMGIYNLPTFIDAVSFHLPGVATFIHTRSLWQTVQLLPGLATAQYPYNGDFLLLAVVLPWHDLALTNFVMPPFYVLTACATYALAVELGTSRATAVTFATALVTLPAFSEFSLDGLPDPVTLSMLAIGIVFVLRYARNRARPELALGGGALGVSLGSQWFGLTAVAVIVGVWVVMWLIRRRPLRGTAADTGIVLAGIAIGGGVWLLRNLIQSGDPLYPTSISLLGIHLFKGSLDDELNHIGFTVADYLGDPHILSKYIYPGFRQLFGVTGLTFVVGVVALALSEAVRAVRGRKLAALSPLVVALLVATLGMVIVYTVTPGSAYGPKNMPIHAIGSVRWVTPALVVGIPLAALAVTRLGPVGIVLELLALAGVIDAITLGDDANAFLVRALLIIVVAVIVCALARWGWSKLSSAMPRRRAWYAVAAAAAVAVVLAAGIDHDQKVFDRTGYATADPVFSYIAYHAPSGHHIGVTGNFNYSQTLPQLALAGPRLGNTVQYVGDVVRHSVELPTSERSLGAEVRRSHCDLLVVGRVQPLQLLGWAKALGYRPIVASRYLVLYDVGSPRA